MNKDIYLTIKYASKKVNLCYKPLAVQICVRTTDANGKYNFEFVSFKEATRLITKGEATIYTSGHNKEGLAKASTALLESLAFGRRVELKKKMKQLKDAKGDDLNWFEKVGFYLEHSTKTWPKTGVKI